MTDGSQHDAFPSESHQACRSCRGSWPEYFGLVFALVYPAGFTWLYFVALSAAPGWQRAAYLAGKTLQFALPIFWLLLGLQAPVRTGSRSWRWLAVGVAFGAIVLLLMLIGYDAWLRPANLLQAAAEKVRDKLGQFGIDSLAKYTALAVAYCVLHSLLEEYYWRWFVFGSLLRWTAFWPAVALSSAAFTAHHVLLLATYFHLPAAAIGSLAVFCGGAFWAWLYARSGSLLAVWLSHLMVDAAIFLVGYRMAFGAG
jgi:membrane protease YdiL (CAAX protease family)